MDSEGYIDVMIASWQSLWQKFFERPNCRPNEVYISIIEKLYMPSQPCKNAFHSKYSTERYLY